MKILIIGGGAWGSALGNVLTENNKHDVTIFDRNIKVVKEINKLHTNSTYFNNVKLNASLKATHSYQEILNTVDLVVLAIPSNAYKDILIDLNNNLKKKIYIVSVAKGFDLETNLRLSETIRRYLDISKRFEVVSLIGPSFADEVVIKMPTCVTSTSIDENVAKIIQEVFSNNYFRVYTNTDEIGAEYAASYKNVIALASGILTGLGYGDNTRAALITRGLAEMVRLGLKMGGKLTTYLGLTGLGDLLLTATSTHSRNFKAGLIIGKENSAINFLKNNKMTTEGVRTSKVLYQLSLKEGLDLPCNEAVYDVLYLNKKPSEIVYNLINRPLKKEF